MTIFFKIFLSFISIFVINFNLILVLKNYQLCGYKFNFLFQKLKQNDLFFAKFAMLIFVNIALIFSNNIYIIFCLIFAFLLTVFILQFCQKKPQKNKLVFTKRFVRYFVLTNLLLLIYLVLICIFVKNVIVFKYLFLNFWLISFFILMISHILILPLEKLIKQFYIKKAQKKLKKMPNLKIIAITGSFAKTSVKNYLAEMLKTKYKVCASPNSFNTEMGVTKVILNYLKNDDQILILEFGADHNHDIKKLCKIAMPDYAILTGVTNQHLKTFKTFYNLIKTKFELVKFAKKDATFVFNFDNKITRNFYERCHSKNKYLVSIDAYFDNTFYNNFEENEQKSGTKKIEKPFSKINLFARLIECKFNETTFYLCSQNEPIFCKTKLLGKHNITNILLSAQMAQILGVSLNEISKVIQTLSPAPHRLNLIENAGKYILDDSFNANPEGVKMAISVLKTFGGKKIVITPGLVELGNEQEKENIILGKLLKEIDYVFVVGKTNKNAILKGLENSKNKIYCCENLDEATQKLKSVFFEGDCVLFLNDLPDNYN